MFEITHNQFSFANFGKVFTMRKITHEVCQAFIDRRPKTVGNSSTDGNTLYLHGNMIANWRNDGKLELTLAGWPTPTTRERLNGLLSLLNCPRRFSQSKYVQYFGDSPIDINEIRIFDVRHNNPFLV